MAEKMRILIVDDHAIVREGLRALIATESNLELAGEARDGEEAIKLSRMLQPDLILLDLMMPRKDGIAACREIRQENPHARILILTSFADNDKVFPAIKAGALGYLLKDSSPDELLQAIQDVGRGEVSLHPSIARKLMQEINQTDETAPNDELLTEREAQILALIARGLSNQEIADELVISERTARTHVSNILSKLHLTNRTQAALYALREGLVFAPAA
jgi:two-component system, NarL family, response regulator LiaR